MTTKLRASVGIATTGDVGMTGANRGAMIEGIRVVAVEAVGDVVNFVRSAVAVVAAAEIASVVSAAVVTGIAIPGRANCRSRRKACA